MCNIAYTSSEAQSRKCRMNDWANYKSVSTLFFGGYVYDDSKAVCSPSINFCEIVCMYAALIFSCRVFVIGVMWVFSWSPLGE